MGEEVKILLFVGVGMMSLGCLGIFRAGKSRALQPDEETLLRFEAEALRQEMDQATEPTEKALRMVQLTDTDVELRSGRTEFGGLMLKLSSAAFIFAGMALSGLWFWLK